MRVKIASLSAPCLRHSRRNRGYFLIELLFAVAFAASLAAVLCTGVGSFTSSYQYLNEQLRMQQAGQYMQVLLAKHLAYNATEITITSQQEVNFKTIWGNKSSKIYANKQGLYISTKTGTGTGSNPLFIPSWAVENWQVSKVAANRLYISFELTGVRSRRHFAQLLLCQNGEIRDE